MMQHQMKLEYLITKIPPVTQWMNQIVSAHVTRSQPVADFGFERLARFYSPELLQRARVVVLKRLPVPTLTELGLPDFFGLGKYSGITFGNTYFLKEACARDESIHFHELVHVVQWAHLGVEPFLLAYGSGLAEHGYRNSPLEVMAYDLEADFDAQVPPFDVEAAVQKKLTALYG